MSTGGRGEERQALGRICMREEQGRPARVDSGSRGGGKRERGERGLRGRAMARGASGQRGVGGVRRGGDRREEQGVGAGGVEGNERSLGMEMEAARDLIA